MSLGVAALTTWLMLALATKEILIGPIWVIAIGLVLGVLTLSLPSHKRATVALVAVALSLSGLSLFLQDSLNKPTWLESQLDSGISETVKFEVLNRPKALSTGFNGQTNNGVSIRIVSWAESETQTQARGFLIYQAEPVLVRGAIYEADLSMTKSDFSSRDLFTAKPVSDILPISDPDQLMSLFNELRQKYLAELSGVTPDAKTLVAGLAIGEISDLSEKLSDQMRTVSLTHLVAVSGSNCAIVIGLVYLISVRLGFGRKGRTIISLGALVSYVLLVGPDPSVLRAGVMTAAVIFVVAMGRRAWSLNALSLAALVLLIADPWLAVEFGFGLSVLATAGILLLAPSLAKKLESKMPKIFALGLSVTISAQLLCLPLLMQLQPGLASYSIIANLLAGPVVAPVTVLGIIGVVLAPIAPVLVGPISWLASIGSFWIALIAQSFAELPMAYFPWVSGLLATVVSVVLILASLAWLRAKPELLKQSGLVLLVVIGVATLSVPAAGSVVPKHWPLADWSVVACDVGQGDGMVIQSEQRVMVVDTGKDSELIDQCLTELGITKIDLLILTHFDFDHVGGLEGVVRSREVSSAIISGFPDDRPATKISLELLKERNTKIIIANPALRGKLGSFSWQVLAPSKTASEASDSNDASVVLALMGPEFDLLLLGDLGLAGQERVLSKALQLLGNSEVPLILKVSHHGSNDQSPGFHEVLKPEIALVSVGKDNGYGHPGLVALSILEQSGSLVLRTDELGSIAISMDLGKILYAGSFRALG